MNLNSSYWSLQLSLYKTSLITFGSKIIFRIRILGHMILWWHNFKTRLAFYMDKPRNLEFWFLLWTGDGSGLPPGPLSNDFGHLPDTQGYSGLLSSTSDPLKVGLWIGTCSQASQLIILSFCLIVPVRMGWLHQKCC